MLHGFIIFVINSGKCVRILLIDSEKSSLDYLCKLYSIIVEYNIYIYIHICKYKGLYNLIYIYVI